MSARHDVIIVGGGPAGSSCARELVRAGFDVVVVDRAVFPRDKTCAGWITPEVVSALDLDLDDYARGRTLQPIRGFDVGAIGGRRAVARFDGIVSHAIRRCEFDAYLLRRSGAHLCEGTTIVSIERLHDGWRVDPVGETRMLVGAGGHFCPVARLLNPPGHSAGDEETVVAAQEIELPLEPGDACPVAGDVPELYFCGDLRGYGWCVRKANYLNVGFGRLDLRGLPGSAHAFVEEMRRLGRVPRTWPSRWPGHAYRVYAWRARRLHGERVLLAGDAAGLAYPASGEGILPAVVSGQLAARVIRAAEPSFAEALLANYAGAVATRFGTPVASSSALSHVPSPWLGWAARRAMGNAWFVRQVVLPRFLHTSRGTLPAAA